MTRVLRGWYAIAVQDAYRRMPWADAMYGCNEDWWDAHNGCPEFMGRKWSSHQVDKSCVNDKREVARKYHVQLVRGDHGDEFSTDPTFVRYGSNSLFQAINLALLYGATYIVLVGADMRHVDGRSHFFGDHPRGLHNNDDFGRFIKHFERAAKKVPHGVEIVNATPGSALTCWPVMTLDDAIGRYREDSRVHRHEAVAYRDHQLHGGRRS